MNRKLHHQRLDYIRNLGSEDLLQIFSEERRGSYIAKRLGLATEDLFEARKIFDKKGVLEDFISRCRAGSTYVNSPENLVCICRVCEKTSSETYFARGRNTCRKCETIIWENNKKEAGENISAIRSKSRRRYRTDRAKRTRSGLIQSKTYEEMWLEQGGVCKICHRKEWRSIHGKLLKLCLDHCHNTGLVRGLLCYQCNSALGMFQDDKERIRRAISYLDESESS